MGLTDTALSKHGDEDSPLAFWQLTCSPACPLRTAALRILSGQGASTGVERIWSAAVISLPPNRRSLSSSRLMQLVNCKSNVHLLPDAAMLESLGVVQKILTADFQSLWQEIQEVEVEEQAAAASASASARDAAAMQLSGSDAEGNEDDIAGVDPALAEAAEEFDLFA